jgi:chondroitin AC lyase
MKQIVITIVLQVLLTLLCNAQDGPNNIIERYKDYLLLTTEQNPSLIRALLTSLQSSEIEVSDKNQERVQTKIKLRLRGIRDLALSFSNPKSPLYQHDSVRLQVNRSLKLCMDYLKKNPKWSLYQLGIAQDVRDVVIVLDHELPEAQRTQCLEFLKEHRLQGRGVGTEMTLANELGIHYGALANDTALITNCRNLIVSGLRVNNDEGIQPDYSFHHDGQRLETFTSGRSYLMDHIRIAWQLNNTQWRFPEDKVSLLIDVVLKAWQWMARGSYIPPGALGHSISSQQTVNGGNLNKVIPFLIALRPENEKAFLSFEAWQNRNASFTGMYHWPYSDFSAYHQPDFSFFVKTISARTLPSFTDDVKNNKGHLLNTGDTYLVRDGMEYLNLMPVWDWKYLPGATSFNKAKLIERSDLAGNVNDGESGLTAVKIMLKDSLQQQHLTALKFYAAHNGSVVCLVGNIDGDISGHAFTSLDQSRWRGDVTVNKPGNVLKPGTHQFNNVSWIHHAGFAYITMPFYQTSMRIELKSVSGSWKSINSSMPDKRVTEKIFHPKIDHGHLLKDSYSGYAVAYASTPQQAQTIASNPAWQILRNYEDCQAVYFEDGTVMAAFYTTTPLKSDQIQLEVSAPCLILIKGNKMYVTDLAHWETDIRIKWNNTIFKVTTPANGATIEAHQDQD